MSQQGDVRTCSTHPAQVQGFEFQITGIFICRNLAKPSWGKRLLLQTNRIVCLTPIISCYIFFKIRSVSLSSVSSLPPACLSLFSRRNDRFFFSSPSTLKYCTDHLKRVLAVIKPHKCTVGVKLWPLSVPSLEPLF